MVGLALSALPFLPLLILIPNPVKAHAATGDPMIDLLFERTHELLAG